MNVQLHVTENSRILKLVLSGTGVRGASGSSGFTEDEIAAIQGAATPSADNVFATIADLGVPVLPVTTTAAPGATDTGTVYTNEGDANGATVTLPTAAAGLVFTAYVQTAKTFTITAGSGDTIRIASSVTDAAGSVTSSTVGSALVLQAINATEWVALSSTGSWSF